jgi:cytochrome c5
MVVFKHCTGVLSMAEQHSSKSIMWATIIVAAVLIAIVYTLTANKGASTANTSSATDEADIRIQPVAKFELAKAEAPAASGPRDGATIFNTICGACHNTGAAGAPKIDDKAAWAPRLATGKDALIKSVTNGKNAMPPKGGATLSDEEVKNAVEYVMSKAK